MYALLGQGQAESDRKSREEGRQRDALGQRLGYRRAEERRTRGQLGRRTVVSIGEDPRSLWTHGAPSLARS